MTPLRALVALGLIMSFVGTVTAQTKEVIPHAQTKPPGPALSPQESLKRMQVPPGFTVELVASEPDLVNPVAMCIDERGRFWITESLEYPRKQAGPGQDRVKVFEIGPDGKASKVTTVITGLNIPSGINVGHGGVWVANSPDILYYPIEDFTNLKLGKPQVVVSGFGRADTHELPNCLTWGPDGWLYGLNGVFNPSHVKQGNKEWKFTCALFRIHPRTKEFQLFCEGTSNPWGLAFNENGDAFVSACVIDHLWHLTETGYYHRQGGPYPPFTWKIGSIVKHKHQKAAYCGLVWYDADAYPEEYRGKLFMGNIHGNCINSDELTRDGSTYAAKPRPDFLTANDAWFMPVVQKVGPDGCLYILDWYDRYHCYQDANRDPKGIDRLKGRLYRVRYKDTPRVGPYDLATKTTQELVQLLGHPNIYYRDIAQRLLVEVAKAEPGLLILDMEENKFSAKQKMHALWVLAGRGTVYGLDAKDPTTRAWAVRSAGNQADRLGSGTRERDKVLALVRDPSADVQIQVAIAARKFKGVDPIPVLLDVLNHCGNDRLIPHIVWQNLHPLLEERSGDFLKQVAKTDLSKAPNLVALLPRVVDRVLGAKKQDPEALVSLVSVLSNTQGNREAAAQVLATLNGKIQTGELTGPALRDLEARLLPVVCKLQNGPNLMLSLEASFLGATFKDEASLEAARKVFATSDQFDAVRLKAFDALVAARDVGAIDGVTHVLKNPKSASPALRGQVLASLGKLDSPNIADVVLQHYASLEPDVQPRAIELLTQRANWSKRLLGEVRAKKIPAAALNVNQLRKLLASRDPELTRGVTEIWGTVREGRNPEREKIVGNMRELIAKTPGDPHKGTLIFKKLCAQCHKFHGEGAEVGPDITGNGRSDFEQLLSNVFDPSLVIGSGYRGTTVATNRGQVITGLLVEDNPQRVVLKTQGGKIETIARGDIEQVLTGKLSYMPENVETQLSPQEIADLFAYLVLDKPPTDPTARKIPGTPR